MMKQIFLILIIFSATLYSNAQTSPPLNKEQTLNYINKLVEKASSDWKPEKAIKLDGKVIEVGGYDRKWRVEIVDKELFLKQGIKTGYWSVVVTDDFITVAPSVILKSDAEKLLRAFKHLQELLKSEKDNDPFGK